MTTVHIPSLAGASATLTLVDGRSRPLIGLRTSADELIATNLSKADLSAGWDVELVSQDQIYQVNGIPTYYLVTVTTADDERVQAFLFTVPESDEVQPLGPLVEAEAIPPGSTLTARLLPVDASDGQVLAWSQADGRWVPVSVAPGAGIEEAPLEGGPYARQAGSWVEPGLSAEDMRLFGFMPGPQETVIDFDQNIYTFYVSPFDAEWSYFRDDAKITVAGDKAVTLPGNPPAAGIWFISIEDNEGELWASQTPWSLDPDSDVVLVATLEWNDALTPKYLLYNERHPADIPRGMHAYLHSTRGAQYASGGAPTGYTLQTATDEAITLGISAGVFYDETLRLDVPELSDPSTSGEAVYLCRYRDGSGGWNWSLSEVPFEYEAGGYIQYDNGSGSPQAGGAGNFYNSWVLMTSWGYQFIQPQVQHGTLAQAQAETFQSLSLTGLNVAEYVAILRLTWRTGSAYASRGKARLEAISTIQVSSIPAVAGTVTAANVPVSATPTNYTPAAPTVEAHLAAIDAVLGTLVGG